VDCREFVELVTAFLDGALDPADEERFVEHISGCDGCGTYLAQFRRTVDELGALENADRLDADTREKLMAAFRRTA
jgi:anti-sigma factor RsiW